MNPNAHQDGAAIRRLRKERDLTVRELARRIGITGQALSNVELENKPAGITVLVNAARELGVTVDKILKDEDKAEAEPARQGAAA